MTILSAPEPKPRTWVGPALMTAGAIAIGFAPIGLRLSEFGPQATAFWRFVFALPMLAVLVYATGGRLHRPSIAGLVAGFFFGLDVAFWHASLKLTSVANATFIVNLGNAAVGLIAWVVLKDRPKRDWFFALPIALLGAFLLSRGAANVGPGEILGDALALLAGLFVGIYLFLTMLARRTATAMEVMFWATLVEAVVAFAGSMTMGEQLVPPSPSWLVMPLLLAVIAQVAGQGLIVAGVGRTPAALAGLLLLVQPIAAGLAAWILFREALTPVQLAGAGLVLAGVWFAGRR